MTHDLCVKTGIILQYKTAHDETTALLTAIVSYILCDIRVKEAPMYRIITINISNFFYTTKSETKETTMCIIYM